MSINFPILVNLIFDFYKMFTKYYLFYYAICFIIIMQIYNFYIHEEERNARLKEH